MAVSRIMELPPRQEPLLLPWPEPGSVIGVLQFDSVEQWNAFIESLNLDARVPEVVKTKYGRALKLYWLGWGDVGLIKVGEMAALTTLELALKDRYGVNKRGKRRTFPELLKCLVDTDGLTDSKIPMAVRCGGSVIGLLSGKTKPTLADLRNSMAHGDSFDGLPVGGLLELVRDLIHFAYRDILLTRDWGGAV